MFFFHLDQKKQNKEPKPRYFCNSSEGVALEEENDSELEN